MAGRRLKHVEETLDQTTGEISVVHKTFSIKADSSEKFFITFLSGLNAICGLSRPSDIKVLAILCSMAEFNTGKVIMTSSARKEIMKKLGIKTPQALSNSISRLKKEHLLEGERGEYEINPQYFWKGNTNERDKLLREKRMNLTLKYRTHE